MSYKLRHFHICKEYKEIIFLKLLRAIIIIYSGFVVTRQQL